MKIAISGKGGVGKTTIAGILARSIFERGLTVLAIDADPNSNLALALGMSPKEAEKITPIAEDANLIEEKTGVNPSTGSVLFRLSFQVDDLIDRFSVRTPSGVNLIVMGAVRSSGQGCMCPANALIRALLRYLLTKRDEVVVVDLEAGVEHFGRGTAEYVDVMLIVTEASVKSLETVKRIHRLSRDIGIKRILVVGNKIVDAMDEEIVEEFCKINDMPLLGLIPYDNVIRGSDARGSMLGVQSNGFLSIKQLGDELIGMGPTRTQTKSS